MINVRHTLKSHINGHTLSVWRGLMGISIDCDKSTLGGSTGTFAYALEKWMYYQGKEK